MTTATTTPEATTTTFTCWDGHGAEIEIEAVDAEAAATEYAEAFDADTKTFWVEVYALETSKLGRVECVDDRYDPDGSTYASVAEFLAMTKKCFGVVPDLTEDGDGDWIDADGETILASLDDETRAEAGCHTIAIEPTEPKCEEGHEHNWIDQDDTRGHGGGITYSHKCEHCGAIKLTDTWAQNRATGEQGLDSTEYKPAGWSIIDEY